jgi:hypothetical protein
VIAEVDDALCRALARALPKGTVVRLDPPKPTWQTEKPSQAIDLFLFGLAGDSNGAQSGFEEVRDARGSVLSRSDPPRRYQLSYLVTARAPKIAEEHELLDIALRALTDGDALPESCLPPALAEIGMPVRVELDKDGPGHLWTSLGMPARAAFVLSVSAPHRPAPDTDLAPPAEKIALSTDPLRRGTAPAAGGDGSQPTSSPAAPKRWQRVGTGPRP